MSRKQPKDERVRVQHMLDAARTARRFTVGKTRAALDTDEMLGLALVRLLEIIGEAAKHVPQDIKDQAPQLPWPTIARTRDRLIHGYFDVDWDVVWIIIQEDLPPLIAVLETVPFNALTLDADT